MRLLTHSVLVQIIIGALLMAFVPAAPTIEKYLSFTSLSVIGLFLMVGLQTHVKKFSDDLALCAQLVLVTTIIPMLFFIGIAWAFHLDTLTSLTLSVVLTTTGTGVTIQTLSNMKMLNTRTGQFLVLVSALDDVPAAIFMVILMINAPTGEAIPLNYYFLILAILSFILNFIIQNKWVLSIMFLAFAISFSKFLEGLHISTVMGGLLAGFILNFSLKGRVGLTEEPIQKILAPILPFYMIFIGMKLSPEVLSSPTIIILTVILVIVAVVSKWVCTFLLMKNRPDLSASALAWGMVPRGIPGFAFASLAVTKGLISKDIFTMLIMIVSVSTWIGLFGLEVSLKKYYQNTNKVEA